MRIREDGKHARRSDTIEQAAEFRDCNEMTASMKSAKFSRRIDQLIRSRLGRDDLTAEQNREIAATLSIPETYEVTVSEESSVEK